MGLDRREFVFLSLMTAAASTFGFGARALTQGTPSQGPQAPPPPPLGNGEALSSRVRHWHRDVGLDRFAGT